MIVPTFVTVAGTLERTPAHEDVNDSWPKTDRDSKSLYIDRQIFTIRRAEYS